MLFIAKSVNHITAKNNPGADNVVKFWFRIPTENREYPRAHRRAPDSIDTHP